MRPRLTCALSLFTAAAWLAPTAASAAPANLAELKIHPDHAEAKLVDADGGKAVEVTADGGNYPGVQLRMPDGTADFSAHQAIEFKLVNTGESAARIHARIDNPGDWKKSPWSINAIHVKPGETKTLRVNFGQAYGNAAYELDPSKVSQFVIFAEKPNGAVAFRVVNIEGVGEPSKAVGDGAMVPDAEGETAKLLKLKGDDAVRLAPSSGQIKTEAGQSGIDDALHITIEPGSDGYPGVGVLPGTGKVWDLSAFGHVSAEITNDGDKSVRVQVRVDNPGDWRKNPWNTEATSIKPGQTKVVKVIFGYAYGRKPSYKLDPSKVNQVLIFTGKVKNQPVRLRVNAITAGGPAGEKPPVKPENVRVTPKDGVMLGKGMDADKDLKVGESNASAKLEMVGGKPVVHATFPKKKNNQRVTVMPALGKWDLRQYLEVDVQVKNTGSAPATPMVRIETKGGPSDWWKADKPLAPGASTTVTASFINRKTWQGPTEFKHTHNPGQPGTGNRATNDAVNNIAIAVAENEADTALTIEAITAKLPTAELPEWVGKRPPVEGDWKLTFEDNFDGPSIDLSKWNIYTANYWDSRSHFSKDNVILEDGVAKLRFEKKRGFMNDDPNDKHPKTGKSETDYAVGYLGTYDKFTQKYGYFEARMKLPEAPGLWPAFWMMPDRGTEGDPRWKRSMTEHGGMEFDIMEHLTRWGPHRYNTAFHWNGYGKNHKATGSTATYASHDKDGFITAGLLWLPGKAVYYANGQEIARWEHERIASVPMYPILYMVSGGWDNNGLDDSQLPADFVIDYIRVWQRDDLASDAAKN